MKNLLFTLALFCTSFALVAQAHTWLDSTFAQTGIIRGDDPGGHDIHSKTLIKSDGKTLVLGRSAFNYRPNTGVSNAYYYLFQFLPDGSIDPNFGEEGSVLIDFDNAEYTDIALQQDNKIVFLVREGLSGDAYLLRFTAEGERDYDFGNNGVAHLPNGVWYSKFSVFVQNDNKILVGGSTLDVINWLEGYNFTLARFWPNGQLDVTFGNTGSVSTDFFQKDNILFDVSQGDGGQIAAVGIWEGETMTVLYDTNGFPVASFGLNGVAICNVDISDRMKVVVQPNGFVTVAGSKTGYYGEVIRFDSTGAYQSLITLSGHLLGLCIQDENKIVVGSFSPQSQDSSQVVIQRFSADGNWDPAFYLDALYPISHATGAKNDLVVTLDQKVMMGGSRFFSERNTDYFLLRFDENLSADPEFGDNGWAGLNFGENYATAKAVRVDPQGRIFAAITENIGRIFQYQNDGEPITTFNTPVDIAARNNGNFAIQLQPDGKIVAAYEGISKIVISRFLPDGEYDLSFGENGTGMVVFTQSNTNEKVAALAVQPDGKTLFMGHVENPNAGIFMMLLIRLTTEGKYDSTFSNDGILLHSPSTGTYAIQSGAVTANGNILVSGAYYQLAGDPPTSFIAQYLPDGALDTNFGNNGFIVGHYPTAFRYFPHTMTLQPDGKILTAGSVGAIPDQLMAVTRMNSNGFIDESFHQDGLMILNTGHAVGVVKSIGVQPDGKIVATGYVSFENTPEEADIALFRLNTDGDLDSTFSDNGRLITEMEGDNRALSMALQSDDKYVVAGYDKRGYIIMRYLNELEVDMSVEPHHAEALVYPNPIRQQFKMRLILPFSTKLSLDLCDSQGRLIAHLQQNRLPAGPQTIESTIPDAVSAGQYVLRLTTEKNIYSVRISVVRN